MRGLSGDFCDIFDIRGAPPPELDRSSSSSKAVGENLSKSHFDIRVSTKAILRVLKRRMVTGLLLNLIFLNFSFEFWN